MRRNGSRLLALPASLAATTRKIATCECLAMLRFHRQRIVWRPAITRVWRKTVGTTVPRFKQSNTYAMRRLMHAASTSRLQNAVTGGTLAQAFKLMHDTVIAQRQTVTTEAKGVAVALPLRSLYQRAVQHFPGQAKIFPKSLNINDPPAWRAPLVGVNVRSHEPRHDGARQGIDLLEFPQDWSDTCRSGFNRRSAMFY